MYKSSNLIIIDGLGRSETRGDYGDLFPSYVILDIPGEETSNYDKS